MKKAKKILSIVSVLIFTGLLIYISVKVGLELFSDPTALREYINKFGAFAPLVFFILQVLQVIIAFIPGNVLGVVGGGLFGYVESFILNAGAIYLGSMIMFYIGKHFTNRIALIFVSEETYDKYIKIISGKTGRMSLFFMFYLPFFPDDALSLLAGASTMTYKEFIMYVLIGRTPGIIYPALLGAGVLDGKITLLVIGSTVYIGFMLFGLIMAKKHSDLFGKNKKN